MLQAQINDTAMVFGAKYNVLIEAVDPELAKGVERMLRARGEVLDVFRRREGNMGYEAVKCWLRG